MLGGIKKQLLDPRLIKEMTSRIRRQARAPKPDYKAEIQRVDMQIQNVVDSLAAAGQSDALSNKLRELEDRRADFSAMSETPSVPLLAGASDEWKKIVMNLENLRLYAQPDEIETARGLLREIIGEVEVREEPGGVFAYSKLNITAGDKGGAQKRT